MRAAYAILGVGFIVIIVVLFVVAKQAHAPEHKTLSPTTRMTFSLSSPAFEAGKLIPGKYTCDGENTNPELTIKNAPSGTVSFVLIVEDPDIPQAVKERMNIEVFDHYVLYNIPATTTTIPEANTSVGVMGKNTRSIGYTGPCPPREYEPREHRYIFQLYALDTTLDLPEGASKSEVKAALEGHIIETAFMLGRYERPESQTL
jgi:Raf kinase inhibitor-like YbhB/YbcL family protein